MHTEEVEAVAGTKTLVDPSAETSMSRDPALEQAAADAGAQVVDPSAEASMSRDPALEQVEMEDEEEETEETETDAGADVGAQVR